jgi:hypothetical protein
MKLQHEMTIKNNDGLFEISVIIDGKPYTYPINSEKAVRLFNFYYRNKATHGNAIAVLNKFKIKEEEHE